MNIFQKVRPMDLVLTAVLAAFAIFIALENMAGGLEDPENPLRHALDSQSWLLVPASIIAVLPAAWRRVNPLLAAGAATVLMGLHVLAFGWTIRCGWALPLSFVIAYAVGRFVRGSTGHVVGLVLVAVTQYLSLVRDSLPGPSIMPVTVAIALVSWGIGLRVTRVLATRSAAVEPLPASHALA